MEPSHEKQSLLERLDALNKDELPLKSKGEILSQNTCALAAGKCEHCRGYGIVFSPKGFYASSELCGCVLKCRQCQGAAMDVSSGAARPCHSPSPTVMVNLFNQANIPSRYALARLENFKNFTGNGEAMISQVKSWLQLIGKGENLNQQKGIIVEGGVGVGKTYLLTSIAKHLIFKGLSVKFVDFFQLITEIKAKYSLKQDVDESILNPLLKVDVLIIDELGKGRRTNFEQTIIDQLVMGRYNQQKLIIASTNCSLKNVITNIDPSDFHNFPTLKAAVGERIYSRLSETCRFWELTGNDYRYRKG
ncbi:MAG: ATP-binding protein [Oligoflexales bacterium]|nr:ATP-binding protein [Oligoflexales bacterium]